MQSVEAERDVARVSHESYVQTTTNELLCRKTSNALATYLQACPGMVLIDLNQLEDLVVAALCSSSVARVGGAGAIVVWHCQSNLPPYFATI